MGRLSQDSPELPEGERADCGHYVPKGTPPTAREHVPGGTSRPLVFCDACARMFRQSSPVAIETKVIATARKPRK